MKSLVTKHIFSAGLVLLAAAMTPLAAGIGPAHAAEVKYIVNTVPVTSYDIQRRVAFLKLQRRKGNLQEEATNEMIDQALRRQEMERLKINVPEDQVDKAYQNFASSNKMSTRQMDGILNQTGVTREHFRDFIKTQIGWNQALGARFGVSSNKKKSAELEAVQKMKENGGVKPESTEYLLQQVIFVVPDRDRNSILGRRKREAEAMRQRFSGCDSSHDLAKEVLDVTVRNLGRVIEEELPTEWADQVKAAPVGGATTIRETPRGVEFLAVCSTRTVSDDRVAELVYQTDKAEEKQDGQKMSEEYTAELRKRASIIKR